MKKELNIRQIIREEIAKVFDERATLIDLVSQIEARVPLLKYYDHLPSRKHASGEYKLYQKIEKFGDISITWRDDIVPLEYLSVVSEITVGVNAVRDNDFYFFIIKNSVFPSFSKLSKMEVIVLRAAEDRLLKDHYSYSNELRVPRGETPKKEDLEEIFAEINKKMFHFKDYLEKHYGVDFL